MAAGQKGQTRHGGLRGASGNLERGALISDTQFKLVGGDLALDFVNTVSWNANHETVGSEQFTDYEAVVHWGLETGAVTADAAGQLITVARRKSAPAGRVLRRAHELRWALHVVLLDVAGGGAPDRECLQVLEAELARTPLRLAASPDGGLDWQWDGEKEGSTLDRILWPVVWHAVDLLRSPEGVQRVKLCAADTCGWLFIDESRRGNRKWCDMADCGNRAKVRRYYRRHRT